MVVVRKYARVVNPQINPNLTKRNNWKNIGNAVGHTTLFAESSYTVKSSTSKDKNGKKKTTYTYNYPYKVTAHDFGFDIPSNAKINSIKIVVRMKTDAKFGALFPDVGFYIKDRKSNVTDNRINGQGGWENGIYWGKSTKQLSKTEHSIGFTMDRATYVEGGFSKDNLNSAYFGVDLDFSRSITDFELRGLSEQTVYLRYVYCEIDYSLPTYEITTNQGTASKSNPKQLLSGVEYRLQYTISQSKSQKDVARDLLLHVPWGMEITEYPTASSSSPFISSVVTDTAKANEKKWRVNFDTNGTATLSFKFKDYTVNDQSISLSLIKDDTDPIFEGSLNKDVYFKTIRSKVDGYNDISILYGDNQPTPHKRHTCCFNINSLNQSDDNTLIFKIKNDNNWDYIDGSIKLDEGYTDDGVSIDRIVIGGSDNGDGTYSMTPNQWISVYLDVPSDEQFHTGFSICLRPKTVGNNTLQVIPQDSAQADLRTAETYVFNVADPFSYHIGNKENDTDTEWNSRMTTERINFLNHRIASNLTTGAFILPCKVKDGDSLMIESSPSIHMYKWEQVDYIGCVPLEHLHFDPKSTYKDKLIDNHYKNKRYMGKELASDEDIDLNVRLHPHQVTTVQGLIDMDKPIPINANHKCFEGDALNHRGWAEIYSITSTKTNPHWYKCSIDVKYLTHNLNTRFHISKGDKTFSTYSIPSLLAETVSTGEPLSDMSEDDYFIIDTDGSYAYDEDTNAWEDYLDDDGNPVTWTGDSTVLVDYDEDNNPTTYYGEDVLIHLSNIGEIVQAPELNQHIQVYEEYITPNNLKNQFVLDEGQHFSIKTKNPLSTLSKASIEWSSSKLEENAENNISRITRLINKENDDVVFEYEYCDFDFSNYKSYDSPVDDTVTGLLQCRVIGRKKNGSDYDSVIDDIINLVTDVESSDETYTDPEDDESYAELKYYGSSLSFELNNNVLRVIDEGHNGNEVNKENIILEGNQYYWETYWVNKNSDAESNDIETYIDIVIEDSILESKYADNYSSLYVSPFPVSGKDIVFTRNGEEGVIYYLRDDSEEFTYLIEPYYQYHNGVDLRHEGTSIFNLNYGYKVVSLENGLVSLGINRLNGEMYLCKWNNDLKEYVSLYNLSLTKYDDININSISDDRIELQSSDTTIIMYRGHPYVIFKHELEDITIDTKSYQVWGQDVDGQSSDYPALYDLMNKDNLLPMCVTGKLNDDCVSLKEEIIEGLTPVTIGLSSDAPLSDDPVDVGDDVTFTLTGVPTGSKVCYLIKKYLLDEESGYDESGCTTESSFTLKFDEEGTYGVIAVYVGDDTHEYSVSNEVSVKVGVPPESVVPTGGGSEDPTQTGKYKIKVDTPSEFEYLDDQRVVITLTFNGQPVSGKVIEMVDFNSIDTATTNDKGQASFRNNNKNAYPKDYKIGARYWVGGKLIKQKFKTVTVKKATPQFTLRHGAVTKDNYFSVKLAQYDSDGNLIRNLAKEKVTITVNNKKYERKTNQYGNEHIQIKDKGTYKYKCVYKGSKGYKKCSFKYREKVKD